MTDAPRTSFAARFAAGVVSFLASFAVDLVAVSGAILIVVGVAQMYRPAAFIVAGAFLLTGAWIYARKAPALQVHAAEAE